jgi:hypothetical protein
MSGTRCPPDNQMIASCTPLQNKRKEKEEKKDKDPSQLRPNFL